MTERVINVAVVGHTNTGKTSLLRTLTRDTTFGDVADQPGTTRHVEGARLRLDGRAVLEWFDTPGMEDSIALLEYLERLGQPGERLDGPARVRRFLDTPEAHGRYEQEARVLKKMLDCDAALYVIDARDPVLGKHRDELAILAACGRPLLPVLNFVNAPAHRAAEWRDALARLGLHAAVEFDTVAPPLDGEQQLYAKLGVLLDRHADTLARLADTLARQRRERHAAAFELLADLLIDVAALRITSPSDEAALAAAAQQLRQQVRQREQACVTALLALYNFRASDFDDDALPLQGERWGMDLFHPQALKDMGVQVGMGAAAGAMAGAAVDLLSAGLSLGTGMLIGAAAGGLWQGVEKLGKRVAGKLRGWREISVDDAVLRLLALRQRQLIDALERRGHAARAPLRLDHPDDETLRRGPLPEALKEARSRPEWSALAKGHEDSERRKQAVRELAKASKY
ncbi:GTPase/DUF3482 domain-containing protein [Achromobacter xylosoxidans]|jgi:hypothetical protein|uniref:GTPase/DUF3482 domain-containing protein n=1 Tax=Alcaligenes xylosoxydans xylosoxydans TaxID=85698 RepID=UPI0006BEC4DD|nr:GTPase/DUF3482 domain-containing protein [Achromobacter xylosoxidans]MCM2572729.1 GTPase/DUF3482 domain-containing protein [Achromobacter xylosoxidans]MCV6903164.1 GTPase/DUF3482 domain-containing protein [Achromobacter xylosoxidans]MDH0522337.1 GTPase/DUF3482 domain-containing protein [Achromobacter xylosoxidans]MDH0542546.1 GTPase/DUF3482 domain-containing protein [Achromobacter xylosoxidans]OFQ40922.1 GTPase SAR1 [Achromobacter xylosoxidans]